MINQTILMWLETIYVQAANSGFDLSDKIALGIGIGVGVPATLATLWLCIWGRPMIQEKLRR